MNANKNAKTSRDYLEDNYFALLTSYVAAGLRPEEEMIVKSHLELNPTARNFVHKLEMIGGSLLHNDLEPENLTEQCLSGVLEALEESQNPSGTDYAEKRSYAKRKEEAADELFGFAVPAPLRSYMPENKQDLKWKRMMKGIRFCELDNASSSCRVNLLKIAPGAKVPAHTHRGEEITLLLDGSVEDELGEHRLGDLVILDERFSHQPVSNETQGCVCVTITYAPVRLTGPLARFLNFLIK